MMPYLWSVIIAVTATQAAPSTPVKPWHFDMSGFVLRVLTDSQSALAGALRNELVDKLPSPLAETSPGWGHTKRIGGRDKKQGKWRKVRLVALNPRDTLVIDVRDIKPAADGSVAFSVFLLCDARVEYTEHVYEAGIRVLATSARARMRLHLQVDCEAVAGLDSSTAWLPDLVLSIRATKVAVTYDNLVVEHAAGVGGDAARLLGEGLKAALHELRPKLEASWLAKADAAIVKAAHAREVRVNLAKLIHDAAAKPGADKTK
jgi:hypothetical protein